MARLEYTPEREPQFAETVAKFPVSLMLLWQQMFEANTILQWMAASSGIAFLDVAPISMMRPDGATAHAGTIALNYDCLHSCEPGPVDTYARLLLGLIDDNRAAFLGDGRPSPSRFFTGFHANVSEFVTARSTYDFEICTEDAACRDEWFHPQNRSSPRPCCAVSTLPAVTEEAWWPYNKNGGEAVWSVPAVPVPVDP